MKLTNCLLLSAALALTGCGGGQPAAPTPAVRYHAPAGAGGHVAVYLDEADEAAVQEVQTMPFMYAVEPQGLLIGSTSSSAAAVRCWAVDLIGSDHLLVRVQR